jgi:valyl-tRNA synthetase
LQTSQGYIIRILQHFATKLWNITNFVMLFQAVMKFLSRLVEFNILVNWGMVHFTQLDNTNQMKSWILAFLHVPRQGFVSFHPPA